MADWWPTPPQPRPTYQPYLYQPYFRDNPETLPPQAQPMPPQFPPAAMPPPPMVYVPPPKPENPRELRNKAEKQRRDKLNQSIQELASLVPPVVHSKRKVDKTGVLRYTAHYLRAHQYVFDRAPQTSEFTQSSARALMHLLNGFLLTTTYRGLIVVVSQNINEYLGYTELELLGKSIYSLVHEDDRQLLRDQLMPRSQVFGNHGELVMPNEDAGRQQTAASLANETRRFMIRLLKLGQRSQPSKYVTCHVEGSFRMADRALHGHAGSCHMLRRVRARGDNPCSSGNDVVFIGVVRPCTETFINESALESYRLEYRTRHSIDGEIIQCEQRISLITGYMINEVQGVNAMNFIHRDEVRWVIIALQEMYTQSRLYGESCYRLMTKNGVFIYMQTRGRLDVDSSSRSVTSFVCTNTVVDERQGKQLIRMMKERYTLQAGSFANLAVQDVQDTIDGKAVEDPRQLEIAILDMVTTLPTTTVVESDNYITSVAGEPQVNFPLILRRKEQIVSAIEKIYSVIKIVPPNDEQDSLVEETQLSESLKSETEDITEMSPDAYSLPPFVDSFQNQNESDTSYSENYVTSSSLDVVMSYERVTVIEEVEITQSDLDYELPASVVEEMVTDENTTYQATLDAEQQISGTQVSITQGAVDDNSALDAFFDDEVLMENVESAMESLDDAVDLALPNFLTSTEIEEILGPSFVEPSNQ